MSIFIQQLDARTIAATFSGVMTQDDRAEFETAARALIAVAGSIHALVILKDFRGIGRDVEGGDLDFYAEHADDIERLAIVGDPKWETAAHLFTGSGARKTAVRYFPTPEFGRAQAWILNPQTKEK